MGSREPDFLSTHFFFSSPLPSILSRPSPSFPLLFSARPPQPGKGRVKWEGDGKKGGKKGERRTPPPLPPSAEKKGLKGLNGAQWAQGAANRGFRSRREQGVVVRRTSFGVSVPDFVRTKPARLQRRSRWRRAHPTREERLLASWRQLVLRVQAFAILRVIALRLDLLLRRDSRRP